MRRDRCVEVRELAPELALGVLSGAERAEALLHVETCARCQALVAELAEVGDRLPLLVAEVEPPRHFERRAVAAMRRGQRHAVRRRVAAVLAVAAAAAIVSVVGVRVIDAGRDDAPVAADAAAPRRVPMLGAGGVEAGTVFVTPSEPAGLALTVEYAVADGRYQVQLRAPDADAVTLGETTIAGGRGSWTGTAPAATARDASLALVDTTGHAVCSADLGGATVANS